MKNNVYQNGKDKLGSSDLVTAPRPHPASLERSDQPDPAHERPGDDSNPAALETSSQPAQTATHARGSSRWTKLVSRLPWAVASTVVLGFTAVVLWRIFAPSPDVWTDDAYVSVHYATIAPRVPGQVTSVRVDDNDTVKAGQVLAENSTIGISASHSNRRRRRWRPLTPASRTSTRSSMSSRRRLPPTRRR